MIWGWTGRAGTRHIPAVLMLLALFAGWLTGIPSWAGVVDQVRVSREGITMRLDPVVVPVRAGTRVVLDLSRPAIALEPAAGTPQRPYSVSLPMPRRARADLPRVDGPAGRPLVVIDAGHGGLDPGAVAPSGTLREKALTLELARAIRDALLASGRVRVALTRDDDRFLPLQERYGAARRLGADLFLSVHCDSATEPEATGASVYTLSEIASDKEAARLAARENRADALGGVASDEPGADIAAILLDLTQRETMDRSAGFARLLGREARALIPVRRDAHRMASLVVLKAPDTPSVLFEAGYISNPADAALLASREGQRKVAASVRKAVEIHFATHVAAR